MNRPGSALMKIARHFSGGRSDALRTGSPVGTADNVLEKRPLLNMI